MNISELPQKGHSTLVAALDLEHAVLEYDRVSRVIYLSEKYIKALYEEFPKGIDYPYFDQLTERQEIALVESKLVNRNVIYGKPYRGKILQRILQLLAENYAPLSPLVLGKSYEEIEWNELS